MIENLNAEVISIGTEILLGELTDTNSVYIARVLRDLGINLFFMTSVGDNEQRIADAIKLALSRAQIVITCGGLGPTVDDKTRQAVAHATSRGLTFHQELLDAISARFAGFGVTMTENNRQQAYLPDNAVVIENAVGTAPSFIVEVGNGAVISLPGVPREMKYLINEKVVPYLRGRYQLGVIKARLLKAAGIGESALDDMIGHELLEASNPTIGLAAHHGEIDIRITAKAESEVEVDRLIADIEHKLRERVGRFIYGTDGDTLQDVLVRDLQQTGQQLAVLQVGVGDVISPLITAVSNGSNVLAEVVTLNNPQEIYDTFEIEEQESLRAIASSAAAALRARNPADAIIVIITDPDVDDGADTEQASVVHVSTANKSRERVYGFGGKSDIARDWVTRWTLSNAWRILRESDDAN